MNNINSEAITFLPFTFTAIVYDETEQWKVNIITFHFADQQQSGSVLSYEIQSI